MFVYNYCDWLPPSPEANIAKMFKAFLCDLPFLLQIATEHADNLAQVFVSEGAHATAH